MAPKTDPVMIELLKEQNRLLQQQNDLLRETRVQQETTRHHHPGTGASRMMTEQDLQLITMAEDVLQAISRWNKRGK